MSVVLIADVGGTHTRLALARRTSSRPQIERLTVIPTPRGTLDAVINAFLDAADRPQLEACAVAAAGRIRHRPGQVRVTLTNAALSIERDALATTVGTARVFLLNDLAAIAASLPGLEASERRALGPSRDRFEGHQLVIGIGTGFGAAALTASNTLLETEAGHMTLAAVSAAERQWLSSLSPLSRVSLEQVLSGPGLLRLHRAINGSVVDTHEQLQRAWMEGNGAAIRTFRAFSTWLGRAAGDLVLAHGAWGGVLLAGGVIERIGAALDGQAFRAGFEDKSPFTAELGAVPAQMILHPQPALLGLAQLALGNG